MNVPIRGFTLADGLVAKTNSARPRCSLRFTVKESMVKETALLVAGKDEMNSAERQRIYLDVYTTTELLIFLLLIHSSL